MIFQEAEEMSKRFMQTNPSNVDVLFICALCGYHKNWEQGLKSFERVIMLDPDHTKAKAMISKIRTFQAKEKAGNDNSLFE